MKYAILAVSVSVMIVGIIISIESMVARGNANTKFEAKIGALLCLMWITFVILSLISS